MDHVRGADLLWEPNPSKTFTGTVWSARLSQGPDRALNAIAVMFAPRARTFWHSHPGGQVLYVTSGAGRIGTESGEVVPIGPGDVVYASPGEMHWHGATPTSYLVHLSLTTGGATVWESRAVSDEEYQGYSVHGRGLDGVTGGDIPSS